MISWVYHWSYGRTKTCSEPHTASFPVKCYAKLDFSCANGFLKVVWDLHKKKNSTVIGVGVYYTIQ